MKLSKLIIFLLLSYGSAQCCLAQSLYTLKGTVESVNQQSVFAADILLKSTETEKIIAYTTTDSLGNFQIEGFPRNYVIEVHHIAFESFRDSINLSENQETNYKIILNPNEEGLSQVVITVRKPLIEKKLDRTVFNVGDRPSFAGINSFELLKSTPGIYASFGDRLQLMGKSGIQLMINGRLQQLNENEIANFLKTLPSENIKSIEIITTPPSNYEAEGNAGIINIITKLQKEKGWNTNFALTGFKGDYGRLMGHSAFQYQGRKLNASISYSGGKINSFEKIEQYNNLSFPEGEQYYKSFNYERRKQFYNVLRAQIDVQLNKNSVLSLVTRTSINESNRPASNYTFLSDDKNLPVDSFQTFTQENVNISNFNSDLYYEYTLDTLGKKFSISASSVRFGTKNNQFFTNFFDYRTLNNQEQLRSDFDNQTQIRAFKLDFNLPYHSILFETGAKYGFTDAKNNFLFENLENGDWIKNTDLSNDFRYKEHNAAVYVSVQKELSDVWEVKAGLRGEFSATEGYSPTLDQRTKYDYFKLFPTLFAQYKASENYQLNLSYSRRINRPDYTDLNPFITYQSPLFSNQGNPQLQPEFTHSIEFNHIIDKKYILTPFYNYTQAYYSEFPLNITGTTETRYTFDNLGKNQNFGIQAVIPFQITDKIKFQQTFLGLYQYYDISYNDISDKLEGLFWMYQFSMNIPFTKRFKAEVSGNYQSKTLQGFYRVGNSANLDIGFRYFFWDEKGSLNIGLSDVLYTNRSKVDIKYPSQSLGFTRYNDTRLLKIGFSYRFGKKDLKANTAFGSASEEEQSRN